MQIAIGYRWFVTVADYHLERALRQRPCRALLHCYLFQSPPMPARSESEE